jgi:translation initiation factor 4E
MLGEQFKYEDEICGAVVSVRKVFYRIALWIKSSEKNERIETIGWVYHNSKINKSQGVLNQRNSLFYAIFSHQLKEFLNVTNSACVVEFTPHGDGAAKSSENKFSI